ncbi:MAG: hypothetical protein WA655_02545 [Candidatus Korobacteraceae bacterium]
MTRNRSKARFWTILALVNLLTLVYPVSMVLGADAQDGTVVGVIALFGVGLVLAVADMISVLLAYSTSH